MGFCGKMNWILPTILTSVITFVVTNLDDIIILSLLFSQTSKNFRYEHIVIGHYLGFTGIVVFSLIGFLGSLAVPHEVVRLLGILPIIIGIKYLVNAISDENLTMSEELSVSSNGANSLFIKQAASVAAITFANGGDNIGIYIPLFANVNQFQLCIVLLVFFILTGVWCFLGIAVVSQEIFSRSLKRHGKWVIPFVLITLGIYIILTDS